MLTQTVLPFILAKMTQSFNIKLSKSRQEFIIELFRVIFALRGRANFTNMARFSSLSEQTFRRHFARFFDWVSLNITIMRLSHHRDETMIGVFDASFLPKSGKLWSGQILFITCRRYSLWFRSIYTGLHCHDKPPGMDTRCYSNTARTLQ